MFSKLFLPGLIVLASTAIALWMSAQQSVPESAPAVAPVMLVDVIKAQQTTEHIEVAAQGTVVPRTETTLVSEVSGMITAVSPAFVAGGFFKKGDVLIRIDDRNYRAEVKRAEASVASAETMVTRETGLADYAEADWKRAESLLSSSKAASDLALRKPQLAEALASLASAQAELDQRRGDLDRTVIRAPYDGLIRQKRADVGQFVAAGSELARSFATDIAEVRLPLPDRELPYLDLDNLDKPESRPSVQLTAEIGGRLLTWQGTITRTEGVFDERSRVLYVVAQISDPYNQLDDQWASPLRIGTFVSASISGKLARNVFKLPRSVLQANDSIWTVAADGTLETRRVELLRRDEDSIYVSGGLNPDDLVCITTLDNPLPGTRVRHGEPLTLASLESNHAGD